MTRKKSADADEHKVPELTPEIRNAQILGIGELSAFLRVRRSTVHVWGYRDQLPPSDFPVVNNKPAWRRLTIVQWAAQSGRVPDWLKKEAKRWEPEGGFKRKRRTKAEIEAERVGA